MNKLVPVVFLLLGLDINTSYGVQPAPPKEITISLIARDRILINWKPVKVEGVTGYELRRNGSFRNYSPTAAYIDYPLKQDIEYEYQLRTVVGGNRYSDWSDKAVITITTSEGGL